MEEVLQQQDKRIAEQRQKDVKKVTNMYSKGLDWVHASVVSLVPSDKT